MDMEPRVKRPKLERALADALEPPMSIPAAEKIRIKLYSEDEIVATPDVMLAKFKQFWNGAAEEICSDEAALLKLNSNVKAIEGAIHTSWKIKKTEILLAEVDEIRASCKCM